MSAEYQDDAALEQRRVDLVHSAALVLEKCGLLKYDKKAGKFTSTELGRIASHYYITHESMLTYNISISSWMNPIELFRVFSLSSEFKYIPIRQDEKLELAKLLGKVPIPIKETVEEAPCKINVLFQAYISRLRLDGLALMADLVYVTQSAGRILRAIFEIALKKGWAETAKRALDMCKMAEKRMWPTMTPLRQFPDCPREIIQKAERIDVPWKNYFDLDPPRMGELLGLPRAGKTVCSLVQKFPRLDIVCQVQPMTRSLRTLNGTMRSMDNQRHSGFLQKTVMGSSCCSTICSCSGGSMLNSRSPPIGLNSQCQSPSLDLHITSSRSYLIDGWLRRPRL